MQTSNAKLNFRSDDPVWVLLSEFSLSDFLPDQNRKEEPGAGLLFQSLWELGMSPECMEHIARTLAGFAREASLRAKQGRLDFPRRLRIFCQKKMIDDAKSAKRSRPPEQDKQQKQIFPDSGVTKMGGWGYFVIERGEGLPPDASASRHNSMDLYLYKEGE